MVTTQRRQKVPRDPTEQRIRVFEKRYGRQAAHLAGHAAFPLTLTSDVVYCLRETFLPECPWYAAGDVLLSGLCNPVGHDLYEMETATRRYLLRYLRDQFGEERVNAVSDFMVAYLRRRLGGDPPDDRALILGEKPQWTALACLQPGRAFEEIRQTLEQLALQDADPAERFRLASLVESYGDFLSERGYQPVLLDWADRVADGEPIDETAEMAEQLLKSGLTVRWVEFDVATVEFGTARVDETIASDGALQQAQVETETVNDRGEMVATTSYTISYFEESLGEEIAPLRLVAIPSGELIMGSPEHELGRYDDESLQHLVTVQPFFMAQMPVTQAQWRAVAMFPKKERDIATDPSYFSGDDRPVEKVSWYEAEEFCSRLSEHTGRTYRLPSEAEWEYACRADTLTPFYFGETITTDLANYDGSVYSNELEGESQGETTSVGQFSPNAFGLYDMHGNVWEWCLDHWHENYKNAPADGTAWLTEDDEASRVQRGGSWNAYPGNCRSACRGITLPGDRRNGLGFRVVCEAGGL